MSEISNNRPIIPSATVTAFTNKEEQFQNETLRPIIKMKHDLLIAFFNHTLILKKNHYFKISEDKRSDYIKSIFNKDLQFKNQLKGIIVGQFTTGEFKIYRNFSSALNKRIIAIVLERVLTHHNELREEI
ncbi:hypothetical protein GCM10011506_45990 [Marivirga lumbricoides]|uniref:Glyoxalase n=1 Tax=Marivirga lumbricoides TaxID=1046115 RepID=A0ABQ1N5V6_9BACT|nr:hypothetical protein GCM10011506_45990 [Marivirga lumbricoides]